ncbi:hypothetical protein HDF26_001687 [Pedobacter cryoconitis]|uniref:eCIS core domain-containing protein n=1 Tax=Pedobacter cryoconitis TaxID=188932 RepID=UPI00160EDDA5|nr:DUF4157 domain-containing protein [Pedobacter cryoconitis]MBB6271260.1 hypothetical protein [Pedobacter cryoconitis]
MSNYANENREKKGQSLSGNVSQRKKENNTGLPDNLKSGIENLSSYSLDDVKVHYNSDKPSQLQAHAYAQGTDIHLAPGQEKHLPHEAWHVVQQKQGRVQPTMQLKGRVPVNDDAGLEKEADVMGARAVQMRLNDIKFSPSKSFPFENKFNSVIQKKILIDENWEVPYDGALVSKQCTATKPYIEQWKQLDTIFDAHTKTAIKDKQTNYFTNVFENDIRAMLRKYNDKKSFANAMELTRQLVQDIKLKLLGMETITGTDNRDGQFSQDDDDAGIGRTGKSKTLRIYRTMRTIDWNRYVVSNDPKDILRGHGGSLGQALHYFLKSKKDNLDDVLVEFEFSGIGNNLVDHKAIQDNGGEGKAPKGDKMTGKSEANDVMELDKKIFSINLGKSKDFITELNPRIKLKDKVRH